ncbi:MAG: hypothetical protein BZ136_01040 [Methanosphaera sp. rholeuAM74]|nr:MAG: hypothetical protein BZ136_01040 [Methanosphaera sp. rholeuAM74]
MTIELKIVNYLDEYLISDKMAIALFNQIKNISDEKIIFDFTDVKHITPDFATQYVFIRENMAKNIEEINLTEEQKAIFMIAKIEL